MTKSYTISAMVKDEAGVLTRIASMFARRGYNIQSLSVGSCELVGHSRMTIVAHADQSEIEQIQKQLNKLIDVVNVQVLNDVKFIDRELILIQVEALPQNRVEISQIVELFRGRIVDVAQESLTVEVTGDQGKLVAIVELLKKFNIKAICRTGQIALIRGDSQ